MTENLDELFMRRCLTLARQALGRTSPNPLVGAVVLDAAGNPVGEGFHAKAGQAHAEVLALEKAGESARGGTLYVNLEPCSHFGRTPPCADRVIASGIKRVVVGVRDPNPLVAGQGLARLKDAGIELSFSTLEKECLEINRAFFKHVSSGLPWLTLKLACTLDGRIADRYGHSKWISGTEARKFVHEQRNIYDCVLVGGSTAVLDDPELNVREIADSRDPHRAVIDPELKLSPEARLCRHAEGASSWTAIFCNADRTSLASNFPNAVRIVSLPDTDEESELLYALSWLGRKGVQSVFCEGGGRLAAALLEEGLVDEVCWIIAPAFFSDSDAVPALSGTQTRPVESLLKLSGVSYRQLGDDMLVCGRLSN